MVVLAVRCVNNMHCHMTAEYITLSVGSVEEFAESLSTLNVTVEYRVEIGLVID